MRSCSVRLRGCTNARETVVFAHAPSVDKGLGKKSPDWWGAFACSHCHDILDGRKPHSEEGFLVLNKAVWLDAIFETQKQFFDDGLLLIK